MTLLPIVARELRVAARSRSFFWTRFLTALFSIGFGAYVIFLVAGVGGVVARNAGQEVFTALAWGGLFFCIGSARYTTDCISEEKREGTLGLLFLTDLKGYDVVMGKLFASALRPFYGLLATVPVVTCALVMGGLTMTAVVATVLALLNVFFFSQALGLLVSTLSRSRQRAAGGGTLLLAFFFIALPAAAELFRGGRFYGVADLLDLPNPAHAFNQAQSLLHLMPSGAGPNYSTYWPSLLAVHGLGWLFLVVASLAVPRSWQDKPAKINTRWTGRMRQWCFGPPAVREELRQRLLGINPFLWLVSRNRLGQTMVWAALGLIGCGWAWIWFLSDNKMSDSMPFFVMMALLNHSLLKFWIASEAGGHLAEQRRSGALEDLLSCTPLSAQEIIRGQWMALRRRFLGPLIAVVAVDLILIAASASPAADNSSEDFGEFTGCMVAGIIMLLADSVALGWVAMWQAMIEKKPRTAAGSAILRILVLPWIIFGFFGILSGMMGLFGSGAGVVWWFILGVAADLGFGSFSRDQLLTRFRGQAAMRPDETLGLLGKLGRALGKMTR